MKLTAKRIISIIVAVIVIIAAVFTCTYFTRFQTMNSIEKLTDYDDGYNLYRMDVKYAYDLDRIINYNITDTQSYIDALVKEALPMLPVSIKVPSFGCTAFTLTDNDGDIHMGRNYDFKLDTSSMLVYCSPENGYKSVGFAALNNVSADVPDESIKTKFAALLAPLVCLDGINEKGVSIAVLTLDSEATVQDTEKQTIATSLAIRLVLDRAATTEEAVALLEGYDMLAVNGRDYHFYITDASGDGRVVEYDCESETRDLVATPTDAVTNFYVMYKEKVLPNQKNGIYGHGMERYDAVHKVFEEQEGNFTNDTVWDALKSASQEPNPEDVTSNTQWSINYNNTDLTAEIVLRRNWEDVTQYELEGNTAARKR